ncbi:GPI anchored CFEM domain protein [Rhodotorula toruloides ATCC 204091]|uniref:GPI anchored CFEM domain protein n=2 Tax=Rhodotorula toruloides TaxID=5286 RepID=A0A2T0A6H9_RHOTO|nr:GPI anchored CFEM domain protein [Rhodotorula toruloides ATCC 204091]PRQ73605.1 GPI anchored CFEM domain protein [Rhodotorula toruloides]
MRLLDLVANEMLAVSLCSPRALLFSPAAAFRLAGQQKTLHYPLRESRSGGRLNPTRLAASRPLFRSFSSLLSRYSTRTLATSHSFAPHSTHVIQCIATAAGLTSCAATDAQCLCDSNTFIDGVSACMVSSCSPQDLATGVAFGEQFCQSVGVTVAIPSSLAFRTAEATAASSATESSAAASAPSASASNKPSSGASVNLLSKGAGAAALIAAGAALAL